MTFAHLIFSTFSLEQVHNFRMKAYANEEAKYRSFFVALSCSTRWVRSTLSSFYTVHLTLSSVVLSINLSNIKRNNFRKK